MMEAAGFSFTITPDSTKNPRGAIVRIKRKEFKDGKYTDSPEVKDVIPFKLKGPDEIVNYMYSLFLQTLTNNLAAQTLFEQKNKGTLLSPQQIREAYNNDKLL